MLRDKLFFFADYLGARYHKGGTGTASVLSAAMRNGDFSSLLSASSPIQLCDCENGLIGMPWLLFVQGEEIVED